MARKYNIETCTKCGDTARNLTRHHFRHCEYCDNTYCLGRNDILENGTETVADNEVALCSTCGHDTCRDCSIEDQVFKHERVCDQCAAACVQCGRVTSWRHLDADCTCYDCAFANMELRAFADMDD